MDPVEEINYENMEQEELIPCNQRNPIVLLERVFVKNNAYEAVYKADPAEMCKDEPFIENVDPLNDVNNEGNAAVKYEIIHDHNEVDDILDDSCSIEIGGVKRENSCHTDKTVPSTSGAWRIDIDWNVTDSHFNCGSGANLAQSVDRSVSPSVDCKFEVNTAPFGEENEICAVDDVGESDLHEIMVPSTSDISTNSDNHTNDAIQYAGDSSAGTANNIGELAMDAQPISTPADVPEKADDTNDGAGIAGIEADASHSNFWKINLMTMFCSLNRKSGRKQGLLK